MTFHTFTVPLYAIGTLIYGWVFHSELKMCDYNITINNYSTQVLNAFPTYSPRVLPIFISDGETRLHLIYQMSARCPPLGDGPFFTIYDPCHLHYEDHINDSHRLIVGEPIFGCSNDKKKVPTVLRILPYVMFGVGAILICMAYCCDKLWVGLLGTAVIMGGVALVIFVVVS